MSSILQTYKKRLKASRDLCEPHWDRAIDNYKHYLARLDVGDSDEDEYPFHSRAVVPISYEITETVMPRIIGRDPTFTPTAVEPDDVPSEQTVKVVLEQQYNNPKLEMMGEPIYLKLVGGVKEAVITGNGVLRAFWRRESRKRMTYLASLEEAGYDKERDINKVLAAAEELKKRGKKANVSYSKKLVDAPFLDDFDIRHVPFFHFFPDVPMQYMGRMRYKIERDLMTFEELADEAEIFDYDKEIMKEVKGLSDRGAQGHTSDVPKDFMYEYNELFSTSVVSQEAFNTDDDQMPLLIVDKMWMGDRVAVFVNEKYNLTGDNGMPNPYDVMMDPFIPIGDVTMPHSYFNRSDIDWVKKLEDAMTDTVNMRFDNLLQSMLHYWLVDSNYVADDDEFLPIPSSITHVKDVDKAVRMMTGSDVTPNAYREAGELYQIIQRATGVNDYVKGAEGSSVAGRTYGGLRLIQEVANARFVMKSRMFEKTSLKALGYFMLELSRQFINKDRISRSIGEYGEPIENTIKAGDLKSLKGFMDIRVIPNSSAVVDQQAEAIQLDSAADKFIMDKGPFKGIPEEVFDRFLLRWLQAKNITDAPYWVRLRKEAREKAATGEETDPRSGLETQSNLEEQVPPQGAVPPQGPPQPNIPTVGVMQSDQIAQQPDPLAALLAGGQ